MKPLKNLHLRKSKELTEISNILKIDVKDLQILIPERLIKAEIETHEECAGMDLKEILFHNDFNLSHTCCYVLGRSDNELSKIFGKIIFHHNNDDCEECGYETLEDDDGIFCQNSNCDFENWNE